MQDTSDSLTEKQIQKTHEVLIKMAVTRPHVTQLLLEPTCPRTITKHRWIAQPIEDLSLVVECLDCKEIEGIPITGLDMLLDARLASKPETLADALKPIIEKINNRKSDQIKNLTKRINALQTSSVYVGFESFEALNNGIKPSSPGEVLHLPVPRAHAEDGVKDIVFVQYLPALKGDEIGVCR